MTIVKTATTFQLTFKYRRKVYDDWSLHFIQWLHDKCHGAHALKTGLITGTRGTRGTIKMHKYKQIQKSTNTNEPLTTLCDSDNWVDHRHHRRNYHISRNRTENHRATPQAKKRIRKNTLYLFSKKLLKTCKNIQWQFELSTQLYTSKAEKQFKHSHGRRLGCLSS